MRAAAILYVLGWALAVMAAAMLLPAIVAISVGTIVQVQAFLVPAFIVGFLAGCMIISFKGRETFSGRRQALLLVVLMWMVVPVAGALPFYTSGHPGGALSAYFEAASGFTTTGATVIDNLSETPASIVVWRALLQWIGGLATLVSLATLLGPLSGTAIEDRQLRLMGHSAMGTLSHMREAIHSILPLYSVLTAACFIALSVSGLSSFDAFCLSLSTLSTGGFMPRDGTIILYGSPAVELTLACFMIVGAVSIIWLRAITQMRWSIVRETREPALILGLVIFLGLILAIAMIRHTGDYGFSTVLHSLTLGLASSASLITTTGLRISEQTVALIPTVLLVTVCIVGGGRFSTAGGLKVYRLLSIIRQLGRELRLLVYPHGVRPSRHGAEALDVEVVKAIWITMTAFFLVIGVIAMIVAWAGTPFGGALLASVGAVSNIGQIYDFVRPEHFPNAPTYAGMTATGQLALCLGMIFGRFEILSMLTLFLTLFWRD